MPSACVLQLPGRDLAFTPVLVNHSKFSRECQISRNLHARYSGVCGAEYVSICPNIWGRRLSRFRVGICLVTEVGRQDSQDCHGFINLPAFAPSVDSSGWPELGGTNCPADDSHAESHGATSLVPENPASSSVLPTDLLLTHTIYEEHPSS